MKERWKEWVDRCLKLLCVLIVLSCMAGAAEASQSCDAVPGTVQRLTDDIDVQERPEIDGDHIVWNYVSEEHPAIVIYTISTGDITEIPVYSEGRRDPPGISGDHIVWTDRRDAGSSRDYQAVYLYTISTGVLRTISSPSAKPKMPVIFGDYVAWEDSREKDGYSGRDIYLFNILTGEETAVCTAPGDQGWPRIWGDRILWRDMRNGNADIYCYSIPTGEETAITTSSGDQAASDLFRDLVLWTDAETRELRLSNLTSGTESIVSGGTSWKMGATLFGDRVVWVDSAFRGNDIPDNDIHFRNLTGDEEMLLYPSRYHRQGSPSLSGDYIVWEESDDIWLFRYDPEGSPPPARQTPGFTAAGPILSVGIAFFSWWRRREG